MSLGTGHVTEDTFSGRIGEVQKDIRNFGDCAEKNEEIFEWVTEQTLALEMQLEHGECWRGGFAFCSSACGWKSTLGTAGLQRGQCLCPRDNR